MRDSAESLHVGERLITLGRPDSCAGCSLWLNDEPQHQRAFRTGQLGEEAIAKSMGARVAEGVEVLANRRMPGGRGDVDFIAVAPSGVYVIDAKAVKGKVRVGKRKLTQNGRDRTKWIDGLDRQVAAVSAALHEPAPVHGVLCFTEADLPLLKVLFGTTIEMRGHQLVYRKGLAKRLNQDGPLTDAHISALTHHLAEAFPRA